MANNIWSNYTEKTATPVDTDEVMARDSTDGKNKRLLFGTFWKWVAKKLNEATISELQTSNKTIVGALNQLNSDRALMHLYSASSNSNTYLKYKVDGRCTALVVANDSDGKTLCFIVGVNAFGTCSISWLTNSNSSVKATYENKIITISGITTWFSSTIISTHNIEIIK